MSDLKAQSVPPFDVVLEGGKLVLLTGLEAVAQRLRIRLDIQKGEWFLDLTEGLPWREEILVRKPLLARIGALFRERILSTPEVTGLASFNLQFNNRTGLLRLDFIALTPFGQIVAEAEAPDPAALLLNLLLFPIGRIV